MRYFTISLASAISLTLLALGTLASVLYVIPPDPPPSEALFGSPPEAAESLKAFPFIVVAPSP